jgi:hypothetical protein
MAEIVMAIAAMRDVHVIGARKPLVDSSSTTPLLEVMSLDEPRKLHELVACLGMLTLGDQRIGIVRADSQLGFRAEKSSFDKNPGARVRVLSGSETETFLGYSTHPELMSHIDAGWNASLLMFHIYPLNIDVEEYRALPAHSYEEVIAQLADVPFFIACADNGDNMAQVVPLKYALSELLGAVRAAAESINTPLRMY